MNDDDTSISHLTKVVIKIEWTAHQLVMKASFHMFFSLTEGGLSSTVSPMV
jgi:hypothetical protein